MQLDDERTLVPLLDMLSCALGAAAILFAIFSSVDSAPAAASTSADPSRYTTRGEEPLALLIVNASCKVSGDEGAIKVQRLREIEQYVLIAPSEQLPNTFALILPESDGTPGFGIDFKCAPTEAAGSVTLEYVSTSERRRNQSPDLDGCEGQICSIKSIQISRLEKVSAP